jgi:hypothetical protein
MANQYALGTFEPRTDPESKKRQLQVRLIMRADAERMFEEGDRRYEEARRTVEHLRLTRPPYVHRPYIPRKK